MLEKLFKNVYFRPYFNPFIWADIRALGDYRGINDIKREVPVVVSLTAGQKDFEKLPITLYSIFTQTMLPDEIVLWLSDEYENISVLPYEITQFIKNGLTIKFVKNLKDYNNSIYAFEKYKNSIIITAMSNFYYEKDWLKRLYTSYIIRPSDIHVHMAKCVVSDNKLQSIDKWDFVTKETAEYSNYMVNAGGVLYPPNCFSSEVLREDIFMKYSPNNSDFWLWIMALVHNKKIRVVKDHYNSINFLSFREYSKQNRQIDYECGVNRLFELYSQNVKPKLLK